MFGSIIHIFGLIMMSVASRYYQVLLAQGICSSIGASAIYYAGKFSCVMVIILIAYRCYKRWYMV
jgi:hypothetical protein